MSELLYTPDVIALAARLSAPAGFALTQAHGHGFARSMVCGSEVEAWVTIHPDGQIAQIALDARACALGQATAGIVLDSGPGATRSEIAEAMAALEAMLTRKAAPPSGRFAELAVLAGVADYPRRHASTLLAFRAVLAALDEALAGDSSGCTPPAGQTPDPAH